MKRKLSHIVIALCFMTGISLPLQGLGKVINEPPLTAGNPDVNPIVITSLRVVGDPISRQLDFYATVVPVTSTGPTIYLRLLSISDDQGHVLNCSPERYCTSPIIQGSATTIKLTLPGEYSLIVGPNVKTLKQVKLYGTDEYNRTSATFTNVPIEWDTPKIFPACWPAENYMSRKHRVEGTPVIPYTGRVEKALGSSGFADSDGGIIRLAGVVGCKNSGYIVFIIKYKGAETSWETSWNVKLYDEDGNMYTSNDIYEFSFYPKERLSETLLEELTSDTFKVSSSMTHIQKLTINDWSFYDIPIQWIEF